MLPVAVNIINNNSVADCNSVTTVTALNCLRITISITAVQAGARNSATMGSHAVQNGGNSEQTTQFLRINIVAPKTLPSVLSHAIEARAEYDLRLLAQQLGTNYRSLMYWLRGDRHAPAYVLPRICTLLKN